MFNSSIFSRGPNASLSKWIVICTATAMPLFALVSAEEDATTRDPAGWGSDHVGQRYPEYVTGDECLFCHRKIGPTWSENRHQLTIRTVDADDPAMNWLTGIAEGKQAEETRYLLGSRRATRFLKRGNSYGKLDLLTNVFRPGETSEKTSQSVPAMPQWNDKTFGEKCAGCHSTAVDVSTQAFSAISLDCVVCHGDVDLAHTKDAGRVILSKVNQRPREVISLCGQCHLRGGQSKSTGRPYPNTFLAGDNLFRDFEVDLSEQTIQALPAIEQHVFLSTRAVVVEGQSEWNCLACHDVHRQRTEGHQQRPQSSICVSCHVPGDGQLRETVKSSTKPRAHNRICDY